MLVAPAMDLVAVSVDGKDQHHDAAHDPSGHRAHWGALNHVQCDHLITLREETNRSAVSASPTCIACADGALATHQEATAPGRERRGGLL